MKYYVRFLGLGVLFGVLCYYSGNTYTKEIVLSEILLYPAFLTSDFYPIYITRITHWFVPLLSFQILFGTYIYRHFCSASVYYFSRKQNRTIWFLKELGKLYILALSYLMFMSVSGVMVASAGRKIIFSSASVWIFGYYLLIHSLYLFVTTLGINVLSVRFSSIIAFGIVEGISLLGIAMFTLLGVSVTDEAEIIQKYVWALKLNPFAHLVFMVHSSHIDGVNEVINVKGINFDLNVSVVFYGIMALLVIIVGCVIVNRCEFLVNSKEET